MELSINRLQINAVITGNNAAVDIIRQRGRGVKETQTYLATLHDDWIEILDEHEVSLKMQMLVKKVIREAIK